MRPMVPADFRPGDRVQVQLGLLRGRTGTIVRPSRLLWKQGWLIELDGGTWALRRTSVTERALRHVS
jgi:hypothetical protein